MSKLYFILLFSCFGASGRTQPGIQWQRSYGGSKDDVATDVKSTADGGYIVLGTTESGDGYLSGNKGDKDIWVLKVNRVGLIEWQRVIGGSGADDAIEIEPVEDGFIVLGNTNSSDGDVNRDSSKFKDAWLVRLNKTGEILWSKVYGASKLDEMFDLWMDQNSETLYLFGKKSTESGLQYPDYWLIKTNMDGEVIWEKTYGGSASDIGNSITALSNSHLALFGLTGSNDGDVDFDHGTRDDFWVVEVDTTGVIQKKQVFNLDCSVAAEKIITTTGNKMMAIGQICSNFGCASDFSHGACDYFIFKLNSTNNSTWHYNYGGTKTEAPKDMLQTDNSTFLICGASNSTDIDILSGENRGSFDAWLLQIKESTPDNFIKDWALNLGSSSSDGANALLQTAPGEYLLAGHCGAASGDVTHHRGEQDVWLVKLGPICPPGAIPAQPLPTLAKPPCNTEHLELHTNAYAGDTVTYFWSTPRGVVETKEPRLLLNGAEPGADDGLYALLVEVDGCISPLSDELDLSVIRDTARIQTENQTVCSGDFGAIALLADSARAPLTGRWQVSAGVKVSDSAAPNPVLNTLSPGPDTLIWTLSYQHCPDFSADTLLLWYETGPDARDDAAAVDAPNKTIHIPVLENDALLYIPRPEIVWFSPPQPLIGTLRQTGPGALEYTGALLAGETLRFEYEVCSSDCPDLCDQASVIVSGLSGLRIPGGITPGDGNGLNDRWVIDELEDGRFADNELIIVNRWGETVYRKEKYQNDWDGGDLPEGVYYYLLKLKSVNRTYEGSLHLFR